MLDIWGSETVCSFLLTRCTVDPGVFRTCFLPSSISAHCLVFGSTRDSMEGAASGTGQGQYPTPHPQQSPQACTRHPCHPSSSTHLVFFTSSYSLCRLHLPFSVLFLQTRLFFLSFMLPHHTPHTHTHTRSKPPQTGLSWKSSSLKLEQTSQRSTGL